MKEKLINTILELEEEMEMVKDNKKKAILKAKHTKINSILKKYFKGGE